MEELLSKYCQLLARLNISRSSGNAPHKPILLLSVLEGIKIKLIKNEKIYISPELIEIFSNFWNRLVESDHNKNFSLPYFHMRSERFWELIPAAPFLSSQLNAVKSVKSLKSLEQLVSYAQIDKELFSIANNQESNIRLQLFLIQQYFNKTSLDVSTPTLDNLFSSYENQVLLEGESSYKNTVMNLEKELSKNEFEEELKVRSGAFRKYISREYNETCAISQIAINALDSFSVIDACHIVPFCLSNSDHITNGIALCPNLHRAFDRGLISIGENYEVLVKNSFVESKSIYGIRQFEGKKINLPKNELYYPSQTNLGWHRNEFGF